MDSSNLSRRTFLRTGLAASVLGATGVAAELATRPAAAVGLAKVPLVDRVSFGAFADKEPFPSLQSHYALEALVGPLRTMSWFSTWSIGLPQVATEAGAKGYDLHIAWQPILDGGAPIKFADILAGKWDTYIRTYFQSLARYPGRVTVRFAHEPNGTRFPWSPGDASKACTSPAQYVDTWNHLRSIKVAAGGANTRLAWCVAASDSSGVPLEAFWPGSSAVDVASFTAYHGYSGTYISPYHTLSGAYARLAALTSGPIWVSELGCREPGKNDGIPADPTWTKAAWMTKLFALGGFPQIQHVNFFSALRERDWRLNSDAAATAVAKQNLTRAAAR
jgi:mannan endo-1,4-beta-mannosidase